MSAEQGGKGPNASGNCHLPLKLDQSEKSEVFRGSGSGLTTSSIWRKEPMLSACPVLSPPTPQPRREPGQTGSHQRKAQSCSGPVDRGQLLSQRRGHRASQVGWGEDGATAAGALVASRCCVLGQLGSTFIEAGPVEEILRPMKQGRRSMRKKTQDPWPSDSPQPTAGIYAHIQVRPEPPPSHPHPRSISSVFPDFGLPGHRYLNKSRQMLPSSPAHQRMGVGGKEMPPTLSVSPLWTCTHPKVFELTANQRQLQKRFLDIHTSTHTQVHIHWHKGTCVHAHNQMQVPPPASTLMGTLTLTHKHLHTHLLTLKNSYPCILLQPHSTPVFICSHTTFTHSLTRKY